MWGSVMWEVFEKNIEKECNENSDKKNCKTYDMYRCIHIPVFPSAKLLF